ncbi:MAG: hypothetical protein ACR2IQ_02665 [Minisyncoccia bacterium]
MPKDLPKLTKLHATRKELMVEALAKQAYEEKKAKVLSRWLEKATAQMDTPTIRKQAKKMFEKNYPKFDYKFGDKITQ